MEEKEVEVEEKYMEGAYQLKSENMVQDNEWIRDEHVRLIPSN